MTDERPTTPAETTPAERRIVVGVDGSAHSILALRRARELAEAEGARLDVVTSWSYPVMMTAYELVFSPTFQEIAASEQKKALEAVFGAELPEWVDPLVVEGNAAQQLVKRSAGADLVVIGSRGHGGFKGLLLGSVSSEVAARAACPVLIMREKRAEP